jgi:uncharacterized protein YneF (UPF0154 family)
VAKKGIFSLFQDNPLILGIALIVLGGLLFFALKKVLAMQRRVRKLESQPPLDEASIRDIMREEMQGATRDAEQKLRAEMQDTQRRFANYMQDRMAHGGTSSPAPAPTPVRTSAPAYAPVPAPVPAPAPAPAPAPVQLPPTVGAQLPSKPWAAAKSAPPREEAVDTASGISFPPPRPLAPSAATAVTPVEPAVAVAPAPVAEPVAEPATAAAAAAAAAAAPAPVPADEDAPATPAAAVERKKRAPLTLAPAPVGIAPSPTPADEESSEQSACAAPESDEEEEEEEPASTINIGGVSLPVGLASVSTDYDDTALLDSVMKKPRGGKGGKRGGKK